ncbi:MAG: hypothetical protein H6662_00135 [Ardenticatenaceae bacterium]|nr:hypothetical protein [Anaerolineales bacterium]MCB8919963.1 hypothetical protein [Ardenticatenaceae bacterium]MCB8989810.1 hypothetical protein [Ardenticatenaceae bacterium]
MFKEITRFVNWMRRCNPQADTAKSYRYHLHKFTEVVGDYAPASVALYDIDVFVEFQAARGLKSSSINRSLPNLPTMTCIHFRARCAFCSSRARPFPTSY